MRRRIKDKHGREIGWIEEDARGRRFIPDSEKDRLKSLRANADFEGVVHKISSQKMDAAEVQAKLTVLLNELRNLGSFESMSRKDKYVLLAKARKAVNTFIQNADVLLAAGALDHFQNSFAELSLNLKKYANIDKNFTIPDLKAYRETLVDRKLDELNHYVKQSLFTMNRRFTLFELYGKGKLEKALADYTAKQNGSMAFYDQVDELMKMLDKDFPTGAIRVPVVRVSAKKAKSSVDAIQKREPRKMALDYYLSVWLTDMQSTMFNAANEALYQQAGLDLVVVNNIGDDACPICSPDVGQIFSVSGKDPDFRIQPYLPRHPNCDCYTVVMMTDEFWRKNPLPESEMVEARKLMNIQLANTGLSSKDTGALDHLNDSLGYNDRAAASEPSAFGNPDYKAGNTVNRIKPTILPKAVDDSLLGKPTGFVTKDNDALRKRINNYFKDTDLWQELISTELDEYSMMKSVVNGKKAVITVNTRQFGDYCPARDLEEALNIIVKKGTLEKRHEQALKDAAHEGIHRRYEWWYREGINRNSELLAETLIDFVARREYNRVLKEKGFKSQYSRDLYGITTRVSNFYKLIDRLGIDETTTAKISDNLISQKRYADLKSQEIIYADLAYELARYTTVSKENIMRLLENLGNDIELLFKYYLR